MKWEQASADYFRLFGAPIILGRAFSPEGDLPNGPQSRSSVSSCGAAGSTVTRLIGESLSSSGEPHTVIGVVGADFDFRDFTTQRDVWAPFQLEPNSSDQGHYFSVTGRLRDGVTLAQAQGALAQSSGAFRARFSDGLPEDATFGALPIRETLERNVKSSLQVLLGAVGCLSL